MMTLQPDIGPLRLNEDKVSFHLEKDKISEKIDIVEYSEYQSNGPLEKDSDEKYPGFGQSNFGSDFQFFRDLNED